MKESSKLTNEFADNMRYDYVFNNQHEELPAYLNKEYEDDCKIIKRKLAFDENFRSMYFKNASKEDRLINSFRLLKIGEELTVFIYNNKDNIFNRCKTYNVNHLIKGYDNEQ
ncbi:hypothetical protein SDC9_189191 [bioreactor metagenome]|uniref:Uncharacterized protein n=1 Tax=bioreactor metagenome TaxID=1076179 RepID=A0A645HRT1_9ZZZZ